MVRSKFVQLFSALTALFAGLVMQVFYHPYRTLEENRLSVMWNIVAILILFSAGVLEAGGAKSGAELLTLESMVLVAMCLTNAYSFYTVSIEVKAASLANLSEITGMVLLKNIIHIHYWIFSVGNTLEKSSFWVNNTLDVPNLSFIAEKTPFCSRENATTLGPSSAEHQFFGLHPHSPADRGLIMEDDSSYGKCETNDQVRDPGFGNISVLHEENTEAQEDIAQACIGNAASCSTKPSNFGNNLSTDEVTKATSSSMSFQAGSGTAIHNIKHRLPNFQSTASLTQDKF